MLDRNFEGKKNKPQAESFVKDVEHEALIPGPTSRNGNEELGENRETQFRIFLCDNIIISSFINSFINSCVRGFKISEWNGFIFE